MIIHAAVRLHDSCQCQCEFHRNQSTSPHTAFLCFDRETSPHHSSLLVSFPCRPPWPPYPTTTSTLAVAVAGLWSDLTLPHNNTNSRRRSAHFREPAAGPGPSGCPGQPEEAQPAERMARPSAGSAAAAVLVPAAQRAEVTARGAGAAPPREKEVQPAAVAAVAFTCSTRRREEARGNGLCRTACRTRRQICSRPWATKVSYVCCLGCLRLLTGWGGWPLSPRLASPRVVPATAARFLCGDGSVMCVLLWECIVRQLHSS